jgi:cold shock CspA family protein
MLHGYISRLVPEHGFGFLTDDSGADWFFVREGVRGGDFSNVWLDQRVAFDLEWTPSGPRATDVRFEKHAG